MNSSRKGSNSERELVKLFLGLGWQALRIAGSGKMNLAPDILAGNKGRLLVIECKSSKKPAIYIDHEETGNVIGYAEKFGGEPWYGFRFNYCDWKFIEAKTVLTKKKILPCEGISFKGLTSDIISNSKTC
jgi:Holliday junction resolvase